GVKEGEEDLARRTENLNAQGLHVRKGGDETIARTAPKAKERVEPLVNSASRCADFAEEVRVREVLVKLGDRQEKGNRVGAQEKEARPNVSITTMCPGEDEMPVSRTYVHKYRTAVDDVQWAQNGMVATIINGEAVSVVQNRIADACFKELVILPLGADKVFVRNATGSDVASVVD
ncbi:sulfate transporter, partial [Trifolium medium]|nr:sulfate transporter [Trifolium medium]